ncbi:cytoplasmic protein [Klebsiella pneumoniae]|uniref:cytoplasmic protein n=1 Tax=Klebsiella pneumoniae TaxID=573 RepID=UPI00388E1A5B
MPSLAEDASKPFTAYPHGRQAAESATRIPEGYILESPGEREDIVLSRADFHALEKLLEQKETWEQVVGVTCFGGATWQLRPTVQRTTEI